MDTLEVKVHGIMEASPITIRLVNEKGSDFGYKLAFDNLNSLNDGKSIYQTGFFSLLLSHNLGKTGDSVKLSVSSMGLTEDGSVYPIEIEFVDPVSLEAIQWEVYYVNHIVAENEDYRDFKIKLNKKEDVKEITSGSYSGNVLLKLISM